MVANTKDGKRVFIEASHLYGGPGSGGLSINTTYVWISFDGATWWKTTFRSKHQLSKEVSRLDLVDLKLEIESSY